MNQDTLGNVGEIVVDRLMSRDLPMVLGVIMFFFLEKLIYMKKSKQRRIKEHIMYYGIGYVALMGFNLFFFWVTDWDFEALGFSLIDAIIYGTVGYIVVDIMLNIKEYFKGKNVTEPVSPSQSTDNSLSMLKALLDNVVLTQKEFDSKIEQLQSQ